MGRRAWSLSTREYPQCADAVRIILVPLIVWLLITHEMAAAFVLFLLAGLSDAADGYLAKRFGWHTELGAYLDPIADKILLVSVYLTLALPTICRSGSSSPSSAAISSSSEPSSYHGYCCDPSLSIRSS